MGRWPTVGQAPVASTGFCITSAIRAASANTSRTFDDSLSRDCWCALEINNAENVEKLIEFSFLIVTPSPVRRCDIAINTFASVRGIPPGNLGNAALRRGVRSEEHTSELQSLMRISYAVFCLNKKKKQ